MKQCDVAVVGASAAGLRAAWAAARAGASVVLLEAREEIGVPAAPAALGFDFLWPSSVAPPAVAIARRYHGARILSPEGAWLDVDAPSRFFDRRELDRWLAREAEAAGARVETSVRGLVARSDRTLAWRSGALAARVVVFADGARSLGHRFVRATERPDRVAWGAALAVSAPGADEETRVRIAVGSHARGGRSQLNPLAGDHWLHWTFAREDPASMERVARSALASDARAAGWSAEVARDARLVALAPDPVAAIPRELAAQGVLVAGGAAGQGGLEVGLASGEMAGSFAAQAALARDASRAALARYERAWKRRYLAGYRDLARATERLARLDDAAIERLMRPWHGRALPVARLVALAHGPIARRALALASLAMQNPRAIPAFAGARWPLPFSAPAASRRAP